MKKLFLPISIFCFFAITNQVSAQTATAVPSKTSTAAPSKTTTPSSTNSANATPNATTTPAKTSTPAATATPLATPSPKDICKCPVNPIVRESRCIAFQNVSSCGVSTHIGDKLFCDIDFNPNGSTWPPGDMINLPGEVDCPGSGACEDRTMDLLSDCTPTSVGNSCTPVVKKVKCYQKDYHDLVILRRCNVDYDRFDPAVHPLDMIDKTYVPADTVPKQCTDRTCQFAVKEGDNFQEYSVSCGIESVMPELADKELANDALDQYFYDTKNYYDKTRPKFNYWRRQTR